MADPNMTKSQCELIQVCPPRSNRSYTLSRPIYSVASEWNAITSFEYYFLDSSSGWSYRSTRMHELQALF